jgi:hypothetical protein
MANAPAPPLIRRYEASISFLQGLVPGTLHQCQGQEAVAVGACSALRRDDLMYSTQLDEAAAEQACLGRAFTSFPAEGMVDLAREKPSWR